MTLSGRILTLPIVLALTVGALAGCSGNDDPAGLKGTSVTGPGVRAVPPPFAPERAHLAQRIRLLGLPPTGKETFHKHALLRIYVDGLQVKPPKDMGLDLKKKIYSPLHTHAPTGALHFESDKPFTATIGDLFAVWGVTFGPDHIGTLRNGDGRKLRVWVNGKPITDPATHVIKKHDNIVISFGTGDEEIDLAAGQELITETDKGKGGCSSKKNGKEPKSCLIGEAS